MLILTRRLHEVIRIGDDITVTVLGHKGGQTRVGIDAPKHVPVHRGEVYEKIQHGEDPLRDGTLTLHKNGSR